MSIHRQILRIALPGIVTGITVPLLGMADIAVVGHVAAGRGSSALIGAVSVGTLVFNMVYWLFAFLRMGASGLTAQAFGRGDAEGARRVLAMSVRVGLTGGLAIVALQWPIAWVAHVLVAPSLEVWRWAEAYFAVRVWSAPAVLCLFATGGWFVGMQDARSPMWISIGQNLLNVALSAGLALGLGLGIAGVATGTVAAEYAGLTASLLLARRRMARFAPRAGAGAPGVASDSLGGMTTRDRGEAAGQCVEKPAGRGEAACRWAEKTAGRGVAACREGQDGSEAEAGSGPAEVVTWRAFFRVSRDIGLRMVCLIAVTCAFTSIAARLGDDLLAADTLLMQLFTLSSYFSDGFALAGEALAGRAIGARDRRGLTRCVRALFVWGLGVAVAFTCCYAAGGRWLLGLFTSDAAVTEAAMPYLPWAVAVPLCGIAAFIWDGIYIGATASRQMLWALACGAAVFFGLWAGLSAVLAPTPALANHVLWLSFVAYLTARGVLQTALAPGLLRSATEGPAHGVVGAAVATDDQAPANHGLAGRGSRRGSH